MTFVKIVNCKRTFRLFEFEMRFDFLLFDVRSEFLDLETDMLESV